MKTSTDLPTTVAKHDRGDVLKPLAGLSPLVLGLLLMPVVLTSVLAPVAATALKGVMEERHVGWLTYALSNWLVLAMLFALLRRSQSVRAVFLFTRPTGHDWLLAFAAFAIGAFVIYPITEAINKALGTPIQGMNFDLGSFWAVVWVVFFAVVTAPLAEEVLFRGLGVGYLLARGVAPWLAGLTMILLFALIHLPYFGVGGAILIIFWGALPTVMRLRTNSLTPGWLMHVLNNVWAYIVVIWLFA